LKGIILTALAILIAAPVWAASGASVKASPQTPAYRVVTDADLAARMRDARAIPAHDYAPRRDDVIGDVEQAGDTWWDYMSNGQIGKMIAYDTEGGVHVTWTDSYDAQHTNRFQKYNFRDEENGEWLERDGVAAPQGTRSGYGSITLTNEEHQRAVIFAHAEGVLEEITSVMCVDFDRGWGAFETQPFAGFPDASTIWPQGVIARNNTVHVVMNKRNASQIAYQYGVNEDDVIRFLDNARALDTTSLNTFRIARSPVSDRVVISWIRSRVGIPAPPEWDGFLAWQMNNDIWIATSDDDFDSKINITRTIAPFEIEGEVPIPFYGDTLRPFVNHDVMIDRNDNIHLVFEARGFWEMPVYDPENDRPPVDGLTIDACFLFHWSEAGDTMTAVADGWYTHQIVVDDTVRAWPKPGAWKSNLASPSLAQAPNGDIYCVFNTYPYGDYNDYIDNGEGRCHGDIAITVSRDNGLSWYWPTTVVNTETPFAEAGEAASEQYVSLADRIDDNLHIFYETDLEAGTDIQDDGCTNTNNPMFYQRIPIDAIARDSIYAGPRYHVEDFPGAVAQDPGFTPAGFKLTGAYPNPFNSTTRIAFELDRALKVDLGLYGIDGRLVKTIVAGDLLAGEHSVILNGGDLAAGVYLVKLTGAGSESLLKVVLVK